MNEWLEIHVVKVSIPAHSTIGFGQGYCTDDHGHLCHVRFAGDHRNMRAIGELLENNTDDEPPLVAVPRWSIQYVTEPEEGQA